MEGAVKRTAEPICTGTTVIGLEFDQGIVIAGDTLASYGKMAKFKMVSRLYKVNERTLIGVGGDYADYQYLRTVIETKVTELECMDPKAVLSPLALHSWLTAVLYNRRSQFNPLWTTFIVGGVVGEDKKPYLGTVNKLGVGYKNEFIATGLGSYLVQDVLERAYENKKKQGTALTKAEALALVAECLEVLWERDCLAHNEYEIGIVTAEGCEIVKPKPIVGRWETAPLITGYE